VSLTGFYECAVIGACFGGLVMAGIGLVLFFLLRSRYVPKQMPDNVAARASLKDLQFILLISVIPQALITPIPFVYRTPASVPDMLTEATVLTFCSLFVFWLWALRHLVRILFTASRELNVSFASLAILLAPGACSAITIAGLALGFIH
jgi:hypothetical protein